MMRQDSGYLGWLAVGVLSALAASALPMPVLEWGTALQFVIAVLIIDLFDIWLPHGDVVGIDAALLIASIVIIGPGPTVVLSSLVRLAAYALKEKRPSVDKMVEGVARKCLAVAIAAGLVVLFDVQAGSELTFGYGIRATVVGLAFLSVDFLALQVQSSHKMQQGIGQLVAGNLALQWPLIASQVSIALLTLVVYPDMAVWGLSVMLLLLVVMRQSFSLLVDVRATYQQTMQAVVSALEAQDSHRRGHAERVAAIARNAGISMGLYGQALERLGYAALLHDVDLVGVDVGPEGDPTGLTETARYSASIVSGVHFLTDIVPVLEICDGVKARGKLDSRAADLAVIVAAASDVDEGHDVVRGGGPAIGRAKKVVGGQRVQAVLSRAEFSN